MLIQESIFLNVPGSDGLEQNPTVNINAYTASASFNSVPFFVGDLLNYSLVASCPSTGTPSYSVKVQACNDRGGALKSPETPDSSISNWFDIGFADPATGIVAVSQTISGAATCVFSDSAPTYRWIRLVVTKTSGSVTLTAALQWRGIR